MEKKKWFTSKTIWVNLLAGIADIVLHVTGNPPPAGFEVAALAIINMILRKITKTEIAW